MSAPTIGLTDITPSASAPSSSKASGSNDASAPEFAATLRSATQAHDGTHSSANKTVGADKSATDASAKGIPAKSAAMTDAAQHPAAALVALQAQTGNPINSVTNASGPRLAPAGTASASAHRGHADDDASADKPTTAADVVGNGAALTLPIGLPIAHAVAATIATSGAPASAAATATGATTKSTPTVATVAATTVGNTVAGAVAGTAAQATATTAAATASISAATTAAASTSAATTAAVTNGPTIPTATAAAKAPTTSSAPVASATDAKDSSTSAKAGTAAAPHTAGHAIAAAPSAPVNAAGTGVMPGTAHAAAAATQSQANSAANRDRDAKDLKNAKDANALSGVSGTGGAAAATAAQAGQAPQSTQATQSVNAPNSITSPASPSAVHQPELAQALAKLSSKPDGQHEMTINLHPLELGAVHVRAILHDGQLTVTIACADDAARHAVSAALPDLHNELSNLNQLDVRLGAGQPDAQASSNGAQSQRGQEQHQSHARTDDTTPEPRANQTSGAARRTSNRSDALDRWM